MSESIAKVIERNARAGAGAPALEARGAAPLSHAGLHGLTGLTRTRLSADGMGRGDRVALVLPDRAVAMTAHLAGPGEMAAPDPIPPRPAPAAPLPPASHQRRIWASSRASPQAAVRNANCSIRLRGRLDEAAVAADLPHVVGRHQALRARSAGTGPILAPPVEGFGDLVAGQAARPGGSGQRRLPVAWTDEITGADTATGRPLDRPRPPSPGQVGARVPIVLKAGPADGLRALAAGQGVTFFAAARALVGVRMGRMTGQSDGLLATGDDIRPPQPRGQIMGFVVCTVRLRRRLPAAPPLPAHLRATEAAAGRVLAGTRVALDELVLVETMEPPGDHLPLDQGGKAVALARLRRALPPVGEPAG